MTLQQLYYFVSACRYENISHAAESIGISQPSVSTAIKSLEEEFEVRLIKRNQSGFALTEEGELFLELATSLLDHAYGITDTMINMSKKKNIIRLGITSTTVDFVLPEIIDSFLDENSEIEISTKSASGVSLLNDLSNDLLDAALVPYVDSLPTGFTEIPIGDLEIVCCVNADHPLASEKVITAEHLKDEALALPVSWYLITQQMNEFLAEKGIEPRVMHQTNDIAAIKSLIMKKRAIGFLYRQVAEMNEGIVAVPLENVIPSHFSLVLKKKGYISEAMKLFIKHIKEI